MALRWIEGFDNHGHITLLERVYTGANTNVGFTLATAAVAERRNTDGAWNFNDTAASNGANILHTPALVASVQNTWILGFAFISADAQSLNTPDAPYIALGNSTGEQIRVEIAEVTPGASRPGGDTYYNLRIMRGVTEIASTVESFPFNQASIAGTHPNEGWMYFQFKITIDNSAGSIEGRYQYIQKGSLNDPTTIYRTFTWDAAVTSVDTQNQATTGADDLTISFDTGTNNDKVAYDDLYLCDSTGAKNNDFLGRCFAQTRVMPAGATSNGDTTEWSYVSGTDTDDAFDENRSTDPATGADDRRITSDTIGQAHLGHWDVFPANTIEKATIIGVRMDISGRMETSGDLDIVPFVRKTTATAAETTVGSGFNVSSTTTTSHVEIMEDDPNTLTDWVFADLDSTQFGVSNAG
jgi:hypothetical protein